MDETYWLEEFEQNLELITSILYVAAWAGAVAVVEIMSKVAGGLTVDSTILHTQVVSWISENAPARATMITQTTKDAVGAALRLWDGEDMEALSRLLEPIYSETRASVIGVTENTLGLSIGNLLAWQAYGIIETVVWHTAEDEKVCPLCGEYDGMEIPIKEATGQFRPPAHPNCRCWLEAILRLSTPKANPILNALFAGRISYEELSSVAMVV